MDEREPGSSEVVGLGVEDMAVAVERGQRAGCLVAPASDGLRRQFRASLTDGQRELRELRDQRLLWSDTSTCWISSAVARAERPIPINVADAKPVHSP